MFGRLFSLFKASLPRFVQGVHAAPHKTAGLMMAVRMAVRPLRPHAAPSTSSTKQDTQTSIEQSLALQQHDRLSLLAAVWSSLASAWPKSPWPAAQTAAHASYAPTTPLTPLERHAWTALSRAAFPRLGLSFAAATSAAVAVSPVRQWAASPRRSASTVAGPVAGVARYPATLQSHWAARLSPALVRQAAFESMRRAFAIPRIAIPQPRQASQQPPQPIAAAAITAKDAIISISFYSPPALEFETIRPSVTRLAATHIREIQQVADNHYEHLCAVSAMLHKLLAAGVHDIQVVSGDGTTSALGSMSEMVMGMGGLELRVRVPGGLISQTGAPTAEAWLAGLGVDPASPHFAVRAVEEKEAARVGGAVDVQSFVDLIASLKEQAAAGGMFGSRGSGSRRRRNERQLARFAAYAQTL
ncbi:hypothetical protein BC831DRAFT_476480 [Entophlyctis helioformis]|nr:hypothetical protein BC831DRAFT_476480 [Entophlyctis helioformis]